MQTATIAGQICEAVSSIPHSVASAILFYIQKVWPVLWPTYFLVMVACLSSWIYIEIKYRYGDWHYPTKNGFSPTFNSFLGVVVFSFFEGLMYGLFNLITWATAYCIPWLNGLYFIPFILTGVFLVKVGIWKELRLPSFGKRRKYRKYRRH